VLDLIRGKDVRTADQILQFTERGMAVVVRKALASAVANAVNNDEQDADELKVVACFADEGPTLKRWRPRARGRATRIRKRTCHITVIVSRLSPEQLERRRQREALSTAAAGRGRRRSQAAADARRARVAKSRAREEAVEAEHDHEAEEAEETEDVEVDEVEADQVDVDEAEAEDVEADEVDDAAETPKQDSEEEDGK